ncbi:uncharacterized protein [Battus philenor]|uniref:uncharacterized protein isoform X2 n=1 Tax=Battus philenor TaxID=42288 RepID=UPI0035D0E81F
MSKFYALYANESGYALIRVVDHNKMRAHLSHGKEYKKDIEEFTSLVQVTALVVFQSSAEVRAYNRAISNRVLPGSLLSFLKASLPTHGKLTEYDLGVASPILGAYISKALKVHCTVTGIVPKLMKAIHLHIHHLTKGIMPDDKGLTKSTEKSSTKPRSQTKLEEFKGEEADPGLRLQLRGGRGIHRTNRHAKK